MSLGIFGDTWERLDNTRHPFIGKICCFVFLALAYILLVNLLIAMMGRALRTYLESVDFVMNTNFR